VRARLTDCTARTPRYGASPACGSTVETRTSNPLLSANSAIPSVSSALARAARSQAMSTCFSIPAFAEALRFGGQHVKDGVGTIKTEKSGFTVAVTLPILQVLARTIEAGPCGDLTFIAGERSEPLTKESFGNVFRDACRRATSRSGCARRLCHRRP
jgi:hypothetical protein